MQPREPGRRQAGILMLPVMLLLFAQPAAAALTLKRVVLSTGGVAYMEYEATVSGDSELPLSVPLDQVDDVLKSITVVDNRGRAGTVRLPGREPLGEAFKRFPFDAAALQSPAALLNALQGVEIKVEGTQALRGRLLRAVPETARLGDKLGTVTRHRVSLITANGAMRQFILEDADAITFADAELQQQIGAALTATAGHRVRDRRLLRIVTKGAGERRVRVAYVVGAPLWKISYRLNVPPAAGGTAAGTRLQGWAIIENMSGHDWQAVDLTLISGRPVTVRQALYTAYYLDRPEVPVDVPGRILPRRDTGTVASAVRPGAQEDRGDLRKTEDAGNRRARLADRTVAREMMAQAAPVGVAGQPAPATEPAPMVESEEAATQILFRFPEPVSVGAGQSLAMPIVDRTLPAERLALYQPDVNRLHPLAAVRLTNDGETALPPGIVTLYETAGNGAAYLGDARMATLPAGEERLISFALDQKLRIDKEVAGRQTIAKGKINRGVLDLTLLDEQITTYRLKAPAREDRAVLIEHPRQPGWTLASPKDDSVALTERHHRIRRALPAGAEEKIVVTLQRPRLQKLQLVNLPLTQIALYAKSGELDEPLRQAFRKMAELRGEVERQERALADFETARQKIFEEQRRIRDNLARVPRDSDIYRRYLAKLDRQENDLERLNASIETGREGVNRVRDALSDYIASLSL